MNENTGQNQTALRRPVKNVQQESGEKRERIKVWMAAALILTAVSIDLFEALLNILVIGEFLSPIISICADLIFWMWFKMLGVNFTKDPKNLIAMGSQAIIGLMPGINTLPELTLGVTSIVIFTRIVDKSNMLSKVVNTAQGKIKS